VSADDPAVYILFRHAGSYLIGDKKGGLTISELSADSLAAGYPAGPTDRARARRPDAPAA